jgi:hypothetical protein
MDFTSPEAKTMRFSDILYGNEGYVSSSRLTDSVCLARIDADSASGWAVFRLSAVDF